MNHSSGRVRFPGDIRGWREITGGMECLKNDVPLIWCYIVDFLSLMDECGRKLFLERLFYIWAGGEPVTERTEIQPFLPGEPIPNHWFDVLTNQLSQGAMQGKSVCIILNQILSEILSEDPEEWGNVKGKAMCKIKIKIKMQKARAVVVGEGKGGGGSGGVINWGGEPRPGEPVIWWERKRVLFHWPFGNQERLFETGEWTIIHTHTLSKAARKSWVSMTGWKTNQGPNSNHLRDNVCYWYAPGSML